MPRPCRARTEFPACPRGANRNAAAPRRPPSSFPAAIVRLPGDKQPPHFPAATLPLPEIALPLFPIQTEPHKPNQALVAALANRAATRSLVRIPFRPQETFSVRSRFGHALDVRARYSQKLSAIFPKIARSTQSPPG